MLLGFDLLINFSHYYYNCFNQPREIISLNKFYQMLLPNFWTVVYAQQSRCCNDRLHIYLRRCDKHFANLRAEHLNEYCIYLYVPYDETSFKVRSYNRFNEEKTKRTFCETEIIINSSNYVDCELIKTYCKFASISYRNTDL